MMASTITVSGLEVTAPREITPAMLKAGVHMIAEEYGVCGAA